MTYLPIPRQYDFLIYSLCPQPVTAGILLHKFGLSSDRRMESEETPRQRVNMVII